jgi:hypothetical protein
MARAILGLSRTSSQDKLCHHSRAMRRNSHHSSGRQRAMTRERRTQERTIRDHRIPGQWIAMALISATIQRA